MRKFNLEEFKAGRYAITRDGKLATFVAICDKCSEYNKLLVLLEKDYSVASYSMQGKFYENPELGRNPDLLYMVEDYPSIKADSSEEKIYSGIKVDDKVVVSTVNGHDFNAYFAGVDDDGCPIVWVGGCTSFTAYEAHKLSKKDKITKCF